MREPLKYPGRSATGLTPRALFGVVHLRCEFGEHISVGELSDVDRGPTIRLVYNHGANALALLVGALLVTRGNLRPIRGRDLPVPDLFGVLNDAANMLFSLASTLGSLALVGGPVHHAS